MDNNKTIEELTRVLAETYDKRGVAYAKEGDPNRSLGDFFKAIKLDPKYAPAYVNRGFAYKKMGQYENALADFEAALRIDPANDRAKEGIEQIRQIQEKISRITNEVIDELNSCEGSPEEITKIIDDALNNIDAPWIHLTTIQKACPLANSYSYGDEIISKEGDARWINSDYNEIIMIVEIKKRRLNLGMSCFPLILKKDTVSRLFADGILDKTFAKVPEIKPIENVSFDYSIVRFFKDADEAQGIKRQNGRL